MQIWCEQHAIVCAVSLDPEFILIAIVKHMSANSLTQNMLPCDY